MHSGWIAWSSDGATLAIAAQDNKICLWDTATGIRKAAFEGHTHGGLSRLSTPPVHFWQATAGTTDSGSGTRSWGSPGYA